MSILTGEAIHSAVKRGTIVIKPFDINQVGANSYDVRLAPTILKIKKFKKAEGFNESFIPRTPIILDFKKDYATEEIVIPESGYVLEPRNCYLGCTCELTHSPQHVPMLTGRSTVARYGMTVHQTAGFGDIGFCGHWTLEITVSLPVRVYPKMRIGQVYFETIATPATHITECKDLTNYPGGYNNEYSDNPRPHSGRANNI